MLRGTPSNTSIRALTALLCVAVVAACAGCSEHQTLEAAGLDSEYVSVGLTETYMVLLLADDGRFYLVEDDPNRGENPTMRPNPAPMASGEWSFQDGRLDLEGDGWTVVFELGSTRVDVPARSDTLSSLRWVTSSEGSPFSACDLVSASEFQEFLNPSEGSGSSGDW